MDPSGEALVSKDAVVTMLGTGLKFVEGPVWIEKESKLVFSDIPASQLMQWTAAGGVAPLRPSQGANGNTLDGEGRLVTCQHAGRNVIRTEKDGTTTVLAEAFEGKKLSSPNDVTVAKDGTVWFTDPHYGLKKEDKKETEGNWVYRLDPASKKLTVVSREFDMPNGLAFSPNGKRLYIADSGKPQRVGAFDVKADGTLSPAVFWTEGGADGIRVDVKGNLYTTAGDGVRIYNPEGKQIALISLPEKPANCAFGGADFQTLFVTARTSLYSIPLKVAGSR